MTDKTNKPAEIAEDKLDEISGGPHFRTWDDIYYDYHGTTSVRHDTAKAMIQN